MTSPSEGSSKTPEFRPLGNRQGMQSDAAPSPFVDDVIMVAVSGRDELPFMETSS